MKEIQLTQGHVALVDDDMFDYLNQWKWSYVKIHGKCYAMRKEGKKPNDKTVYLHSVIMRTPSGKEIDHKNHDGLNNQGCNLRICSRSQNQMNGNLRFDNTSGYKGVNWSKSHRAWRAYIYADNKQVFLGYFNTPEAAANAYDHKAIELFGEFARINGV